MIDPGDDMTLSDWFFQARAKLRIMMGRRAMTAFDIATQELPSAKAPELLAHAANDLERAV